MPEWLKGTDCKSVAERLRRFKSFSIHPLAPEGRFAGPPGPGHPAGVAQLVERQPSKLNVASSNLVSRSTLFDGLRVFRSGKLRAGVAQQVEHVLGKDEVTGSSPVVGSG